MNTLTRCFLCFGMTVLLASLSEAQSDDRIITVKAYGGVTTAARLLDNPEATNLIERTSSRAFNGMLSGGIEVGMPLLEGDIVLFIAAEYAEYIKDSREPYAFPGGLRLVMTDEGIRFLPIEIGAHARIPLGSETFHLSMGGGVGVYNASRVLRIEGRESRVTNTPTDVNIFVDVTFGYRLSNRFLVEAGVRFRDPETMSDNRFDPGTISQQGVTAALPTRTLPSRIIVDGMRFSLGLLFEVR